MRLLGRLIGKLRRGGGASPSAGRGASRSGTRSGSRGGGGGNRGSRGNRRRKRDIDIDIDSYGTGLGGFAREFFSNLFGVDYSLKNNNALGLVGDAIGGGARKNMNMGRPAPQFTATAQTAKRYNNPTLQIISFQISDIIDSMSSINSELKNQLDLTRYNYNQSLQVQREGILEAGAGAAGGPQALLAANDNAVSTNVGASGLADAINKVTDQLLELSKSLEDLNFGGGGGLGGAGGMPDVDIDVDRYDVDGGSKQKRSLRSRLRRQAARARRTYRNAARVASEVENVSFLGKGARTVSRLGSVAAVGGIAADLGGNYAADKLGRDTKGGAAAAVLGKAGEYSGYGTIAGAALGGLIGAFFGGVGAVPGALIGSRLGALAGAALGGGMGLIENSSVLFGTGAQGPATPQLPVNNAAILATIRQKESGGNYNTPGPVGMPGSASGAYGFTDGTWRTLTARYGIGTQYPRAHLAPPAIQDAIADRYVSQILQENGGDVSKVPLVWYTGNPQGQISDAALRANRGLTPQQYQQDWLSRYGGNVGMPTGLYAAPSATTGVYSYAAPTPPITPTTTRSGDSSQARQTLLAEVNSIQMGRGPVEFTARNNAGHRYRAKLIPSQSQIDGVTIRGNSFVLEMKDPTSNKWTYAMDYAYDTRDRGRAGRQQLYQAVLGNTLLSDPVRSAPPAPRTERRAASAAPAPRRSTTTAPPPAPAAAAPVTTDIPRTGPILEANSREVADILDRPNVNIEMGGQAAATPAPGTTMAPATPTSVYGMQVLDSPSSPVLADVMHKLKYYPASR